MYDKTGVTKVTPVFVIIAHVSVRLLTDVFICVIFKKSMATFESNVFSPCYSLLHIQSRRFEYER